MSTDTRKFVTVVYEIKDEAAWRDGGNPLRYEHDGLKAVCVCAGDLASLKDQIEELIKSGETLDADKWDDLYKQFVAKALQ